MKINDEQDFKTKPKPVTFASDESVRQALNVMCEKNIGSIIVVDEDQKVVGIITERDMMIRMLGQNRNPDTTKISEIMSTNIRLAKENDNLFDWIHTMSSERFRHLPVVDEQNKLVGMMSQGDFVARAFPDLYEVLRHNLKSRLGSIFQISLFIFAILTLGLIAFKL